MRPTIAKLRKTLPAFLTIEQYCELTGRCRASAFKDMRLISGLGVKLGAQTRIVRDVALDEMERAQAPLPWIPLKDRDRAAADIASPKTPARVRSKASAAVRRERDGGVCST
jgi:hypothetical protein